MDILRILLGLVILFFLVMDLLSPSLKRIKQNFKDWFLEKCHAVIVLNREELIVKLKPRLYGLGIFLVVLASIILQVRGDNDPDVAHLSFAGIGILFVVSLGLVSYSKLGDSVKIVVKVGYKITKWLALIMIAICVLFVIFYATVHNQPINSTLLSNEVIKMIAMILGCCAIAGILADLILSAILIVIPFYCEMALAWSVKKTAYLVVNKTAEDSTRIPLIIISAIFLIRSIYLYLI